MRTKVFVIDYELVSPLGIGNQAVWNSIVKARSAVGKITNFYSDGLDIDIGAEIKDDLSVYYSDVSEQEKFLIKRDRKFELLYVVYRLFAERLRKILSVAEPSRAGIVLGIGADSGAFEFLEEYVPKVLIEASATMLELKGYFHPIDIYSYFFAEKLNLKAFQQALLTACAASNQAIGWAAEAIAADEADVVIAGGTDSIINTIGFIAFEKLGTLTYPDEPVENSCKPFDINRSGTVSGEAAGLIVLASEKYVQENNLKPKFQILGYGSSLDAYMITAPDPSGDGMRRAMEAALEQAEIDPKLVEFISAHGTGTELNDSAEVKALNNAFGKYLEQIPVTSTKDRHGHAIAAAGVQEFIIAAMAVENSFLPHVRNLKNPIQDRWFRPIISQSLQKQVTVAMNCNYGFGGVNSAIIFKRV